MKEYFWKIFALDLVTGLLVGLLSRLNWYSILIDPSSTAQYFGLWPAAIFWFLGIYIPKFIIYLLVQKGVVRDDLSVFSDVLYSVIAWSFVLILA